MRKLHTMAAAAGTAGALLATAPAKADPVADFYKGKTVSIYVGVSPGGIYSTFAQFLSKHMQKHFPGNPEIIVKHMPGAGGQKVMNYVYNVAPKDGTAILTPNSNPVKSYIFGVGKPRYEPLKFQWIGAWSYSTVALTLLKKNAPGVNSIADATKTQVILGSIGKTTTSYQVPFMLNNLVGTKFKIIPGYRGGSPIRLAMEKGEVAGWSGQWTGMKLRKPEWVKDNMLATLVQVAPKKNKDLKNVPLLTELAKDDDQKAMFDVLSSTIMDRAVALPPGVPKDRVDALEKAFMATLKDKDFLADVEKRGFEIDPTSAADVTATVKKIMGLSKERLVKLKTAMGFAK
ncbi:MAG: Bug family tripartite tricarboxylate transporter substrate binding protein [Beijerinckiaceae bacterium]